ncbi:DUF423 domain-containing protein [Flavobacterium agrisoli]|uniref:DUF423 domain-containing protein n=1 Tax=Flavobacterium agrisoli TaxID=2793066 RepID=A0A934PQ53_9FLAO|nr:DUF423 domain-containing protein [Flavobacterium agrisoli]MBK0370573.1 DUF423 domain-containing protein [Flavobacterium agrisoli]
MKRKMILIAAFLGVTAIALGAFGAHGLKQFLSEAQLTTFETGVRYQMYHALFLLFVANLIELTESKRKIITLLVVLGVALFSGSIYLLATNSITSFDFKIIGFVTPIGGLLLIISWIVLFAGFFNKKS